MANNFNSTRLALGVLLLSLACLPAWAEHVSIVATVNDDVITSTDLAERRAIVMHASDIADTPENAQRITPRVLQSLIDEALELQEAKRQSITISDADVDKTLDGMSESKAQAPGSLKKALEAQGLSVRSLKSQIRAQLAWSKVVQRKLRRNVTISHDELVRAQQAQAADPGTEQVRVTALIVPIPSSDKAVHTQRVISEISTSLKSGQDLAVVAEHYTANEEVKLAPPVWISEETLPPEIGRALHRLKPGETSAPLHMGNAVQFVKLLERKTIKKPNASTEVLIKQISIDVPANPKKAVLAKLTDTEHMLRSNPGSCEEAKLPNLPMPAEVKFAHMKMGDLSPEQRSIITRLGVGELSEPLVSPGKMRLVLLCERMETASDTGDLEGLRQQLFAEKMELEAQKHLRNLRRDATIDIRSDDK